MNRRPSPATGGNPATTIPPGFPATAPLGYGENLVATPLPEMPGGYSTLYLRKQFNVPDAAALDRLQLELLYDDGVNVWINGTHVLGVNVPGHELPHTAVASASVETGTFIPFALPNPQAYLVTGINVIAVQLVNAAGPQDDDALFDARLVGVHEAASGATPGSVNSMYDNNAPPQFGTVAHTPRQPAAGQNVKVTASLTDPDGIESVIFWYQLVNPGSYIPLDDPRYQTDWIPLLMNDAGTGGDDRSGDGTYSVLLPGVFQTHRRLVRYRITAADTQGAEITAPYPDDPQPNFAYFVYDGVPAWIGSAQPGVAPAVNYRSTLLDTVPAYHLITDRQDRLDSQTVPYRSGAADQQLPNPDQSYYRGSDYPWLGTLVFNGVVYDHVRYQADGDADRYAMGKNAWTFDFPLGHGFQAQDNYDTPYGTTWDKLNLSAIIQQGDLGQRGEQGLFEAVGFRLHNLAGNAAPNTNFVNFRLVESASQTGPDQFSGDFQGLYLAIEQPDGNFLAEHLLPDGNLYRMEGGTGTLTNQGPAQPPDKSDLAAFLEGYRNAPTQQWWEENLDLENYFSFRAISLAIHDYDDYAGTNYLYYHHPETDKWSIVNWDLDRTWTTTYTGGGGAGPLPESLFDSPQFRIAYNNRLREITDLLFNPEQTGMLIDEIASFVYTPGQTSLVNADAARWDYNPVLASSYVDPLKAGQGRFYESSPTRQLRRHDPTAENLRGRHDGRDRSADRFRRRPTARHAGDQLLGCGGVSGGRAAFSDVGLQRRFGGVRGHGVAGGPSHQSERPRLQPGRPALLRNHGRLGERRTDQLPPPTDRAGG